MASLFRFQVQSQLANPDKRAYHIAMFTTLTIDSQDLILDEPEVFRALGYPAHAPEAIQATILDLWHEARLHINGQYAYDRFPVSVQDRTIIVNDTTFECGPTIAKHLKASEEIAIFAATLGPDFDAWSKAWFDKDPLNGYIANTLGSISVESMVDQLERRIVQEASQQDLACSNRLSPGYCNWNVEEQKKLFSLLPDECCDITLTDSCLMVPIKSVTGVIGLGVHQKRLEYSCQLCDKHDCLMRKGH